MKTISINEDDEIRSIIKSCKTCFLGLADTDGTPYVVPMNFGYEDGIIYLHSAPEGNLIDIVSRNNKVCITFCTDSKLVFQHPQVACSYRMKSQSVIAWGNVEFIDDLSEKERVLNILMAQYSDKKFTYSLPALKNVKIWQIKTDRISCKSFAEPHKKQP
jgi:nitroimidazol reductase NimA-like FMN-containing flavoprotein (pyridoxamine 5'-phosphate oxidase superfamily)